MVGTHSLRRRVTLGALVLLCATALPAVGYAAACCGGASPTAAFSLPTGYRYSLGVSLRYSSDFALRDAAGTRFDPGTQVHESRLVLGGAWQARERWQLGASLPLIVGTQAYRAAPRDTWVGHGDLFVESRTAIVREETCYARPMTEMAWDELKPDITWVLGVRVPLSARWSDPAGLSIDPGRSALETGVDITKVWGRLGNAGSLRAGWDRGWRAPALSDLSTLRLEASLSQLVYIAYQRYVGAYGAYRSRWGLGDNLERNDSVALGLLGGVVLAKPQLRLVGSVALDGLAGRSTAVSPLVSVTVVKLLY